MDLDRKSVQQSLGKTLWTFSILLIAFWTYTWPLKGLRSPTNKSPGSSFTGSKHYSLLTMSECDDCMYSLHVQHKTVETINKDNKDVLC